MAKATTLTDDIDGSPGAIERRFTVDGVEYSIDLTDQHYDEMMTAFSVWLTNARIAKVSRTNKAPVASSDDRAKIRAWAKERGHNLASRGRFPNEIVRAYYEDQEDVQIAQATLGYPSQPQDFDDKPLELVVTIVGQ